MSVLRHPDACEVCRGKLTGAVEIELEREGGGYYINLRQNNPRDWGICPKCKRVACFAECWDKTKSGCKFCPSPDAAGNCPECRRVLIGAIEVREIEVFDIPTIGLEETPDRNWIQCDACGLVICKACCLNPKSGFCDKCLALQRGDNAKPRCPVVAAIVTGSFDPNRLFQAVETKTQINQEEN